MHIGMGVCTRGGAPAAGLGRMTLRQRFIVWLFQKFGLRYFRKIEGGCGPVSAGFFWLRAVENFAFRYSFGQSIAQII